MLIKIEKSLTEEQGNELCDLLMRDDIIDIVNGLFFRKDSSDCVDYIADVDDVNNANIECHAALTRGLIDLDIPFRSFTTNE